MEIQTKDIKDLKEAKYNPNEADEETLQGLQASIKKFGYIEPIVWNKRSGNIVGGHQRVKTLKKLGKKKLKVSVVDLSPVEEKTLNATLNNPHIRGQMNPEKLEIVLDEIKIEVEEFEDLKLDDLEIKVEEVEIVEDEPSEIEEKEISKTGDLWLLGEHRLLCGDSTKVEDFEKLVGDEKIILMVTDPPYGVDYKPEWRDSVLASGKRARGKVKNDDVQDWSGVYEIWTPIVLYLWHSIIFSELILTRLKEKGYKIITQIIWVKQHFVISQGDYHGKHEPCIYAVKKGKNHNWQGARDQSTVWEIKNNNRFGNSEKEETFGHGTQKPLECMSRPIRNNSKIGDSVCDPFGGTGTTLIACEQTNRKCFMMEIEPKYCDVIVKRWQKLTGREAILEGTKKTFEKVVKERCKVS